MTTDRLNIHLLNELWVAEFNGDVITLAGSAKNSLFCACAVKVRPKIVQSVVILPKFQLLYRKSTLMTNDGHDIFGPKVCCHFCACARTNDPKRGKWPPIAEMFLSYRKSVSLNFNDGDAALTTVLCSSVHTIVAYILRRGLQTAGKRKLRNSDVTELSQSTLHNVWRPSRWEWHFICWQLFSS